MAIETAAAVRPLEVVLIEDNPAEAVLVEESIRESAPHRFSVVSFSRLSAAMHHVDRVGADCVLLDLSLPDAVGLEGVRALLSAFPDLPVVVLTGHDDTSLALEAVSAGADDYLVKRHVEGDAIVRALRYAIERSRARAQLVHQAMHDVLTGLPNRALFADRLEQALARSERTDRLVAGIFLDLGRFKTINDSLGREAGGRGRATGCGGGWRPAAATWSGRAIPSRASGATNTRCCVSPRARARAWRSRIGWAPRGPLPPDRGGAGGF